MEERAKPLRLLDWLVWIVPVGVTVGIFAATLSMRPPTPREAISKKLRSA